MPVPEAVSLRLVMVVGALLWLYNWTCSMGAKKKGICVELEGSAGPRDKWTKGGVGIVVKVGVNNGDKVPVGVWVGVFVGVLVGNGLPVLVGVFVGVLVGVLVGVIVGAKVPPVIVGVAVLVLVGVMVANGQMSA